MARLAERLCAQGCQRWALYVKRDNTPALRLYASVGMRPVRQAAALLVTRAQVAVLPAVPPGLRVVPAGRVDFDALTAAFGMLPGKLARCAEKPSHQLFLLAHPDGGSEPPLGMMDQRAAGQLLFPFFAVSPGHAHALLEAAFARLPHDVAELSVVVTDDAPLDGLLREAGAQVRNETLELRGSLPPPAPEKPTPARARGRGGRGGAGGAPRREACGYWPKSVLACASHPMTGPGMMPSTTTAAVESTSASSVDQLRSSTCAPSGTGRMNM